MMWKKLFFFPLATKEDILKKDSSQTVLMTIDFKLYGQKYFVI